MDAYFLWAASFIALLFVSGMVFVFAKKWHIPYTIALVACGILLGLFVKYIPALSFLTAFELTEQTLLYVFLPVLLFESAYNIRFREIIQHTRAIGLLAVVGLLVSAVLIACWLSLLLGWTGMVVPFLVLFLFGTLISATDPVSVLALFKEMGAPRRLTLLFEGESLFNDGTALALLLVILSVLLPHTGGHESWFSHIMVSILPVFGWYAVVVQGIVSFLLMIVMGFLIWGGIGYVASRSLEWARQSKPLEVTITIILAHATFLFAEWVHHAIVPVSAVIATTVAALVMGNYGRYKLSTETRHMMAEYWEFFAFIANSLVFLLVGVMIVGLGIHFSEMIVPILLSIVVVALARAISVYSVLIPLNATKTEFHIPLAWMHLLSWGSLRGGLAIIMALFIPADFTLPGWTLDTSIRDFVLALTVGCVVFTTFFKATTIPWFLRKFRITSPTLLDTIDIRQGKLMLLLKMHEKMESTAARGFMLREQKTQMESWYHRELEAARQEFLTLSQENPEAASNALERVLALHALEIERSLLLHLFAHHEIPEWILRRMIAKIESQIERIEDGKTQIKEAYEHKLRPDRIHRLMSCIVSLFEVKRDADEEKYIKARTRMIILEKVLARFEIFYHIPEVADSAAFRDIMALYTGLLARAKNTREELYAQEKIQQLEQRIVQDMLSARKEEIIERLVVGGLISPKTAHHLDGVLGWERG